MSSPDERMARRLVRLLFEDFGAPAIARIVEEERRALGAGAGEEPRRRPTLSLAEAARRAADQVPPDELAAAIAKRERRRW